MAPRRLLELIAGVGVLACLAALALALLLPVPSMRIVAHGDGLKLDGFRFDTEQQARTHGAIEAFILDDGTRIGAHASLVMEEPDVLPSYEAFNRFMAEQDAIARGLRDGRIDLELDDGSTLTIEARRRGLIDLPLELWLQLAFGLAGLVLGAGVWVFRRKDVAAAMYALTGAGFALSCVTAAVYSTRELALAGTWFRVLSGLNHLGAIGFAGALLALVWNYPRPVARFPILRVALGTALAWTIIDVFQLLDKSIGSMQVGIMVLFLPCFPVAAIQWVRSRQRPVERAALKWFFLSLFSGTSLFAGFVLVPPIFGGEPFAPQSLMLGVFLLVYAGIALALIRYRLFDIERWWFSAWVWFFGGVLVIALDALLVFLLQLSGLAAGAIALAAAGWLYFPLRQCLWQRILPDQTQRFADLLPRLVARAALARDTASLREVWRRMVEDTFSPLKIERIKERVESPRIDQDGQRMVIPLGIDERATAVSYPNGGSRLFSRADLKLAETLRSLVQHAAKAIDERERGIEDERQRIMRDMHDDLGSKLLAMSHSSDESVQQIARSALQDVRDILQALEAGPASLSELLEVCRWELQSRAELHGFEATFTAEVEGNPRLTAREATNVARIVREAVTNAVRHGKASMVSVRIDTDGQQLRIEVRDNGTAASPDTWPSGRGRRTMQARAADLDGGVTWMRDEARAETVVVAVLRLGSTESATTARAA